ncbi:MAG: TolC family protein [Candidatus Gastranaerophilales bacterium]|nr:TolC family protein [Candidatus Gastranaerophilales bacterium]
MKYFFRIFVIIFFITGITFAEENSKAETYDIDFPTAYELMFNNNSHIKALLENINVHRYKKNSAIGEFLPKIYMNASFVHFNNDINTEIPYLPLGGQIVPIPNLTIQDKNVGTFGFTALWNVFTGGKIIAYNSAARANLLGADLKYKSMSNQLTVKLVKAYFGLSLAKDTEKVRKSVLDSAQKHLDDAEKMEKEGLIPKSERLHAEVAYRQALKEYNSAQKDVLIAEEGLKNLIKDENADLTNVSINPTSFLFVSSKELASLETLKEDAVKNNPDFKQTAVQKKLADANYLANVANYSPSISVVAYDIVGQGNLAKQIPREGIGVMGNFTLFNGFSRYNDLKAAKSLKKQVQHATNASKNDIEYLVAKNYNELFKYKEQYESSEKSIEKAQESLRCAMLAFKEGYGTSLSVTDAQTMLGVIKIQKLKAVYDYDVKLVELLANTGNSEAIFDYLKDADEIKF